MEFLGFAFFLLRVSALFLFGFLIRVFDHHHPAFFLPALFLSASLIDHPAGYLFRIPLCTAVTDLSFHRRNLINSLILSLCLYFLSVALPQSASAAAGFILRVAFCLAVSSLSRAAVVAIYGGAAPRGLPAEVELINQINNIGGDRGLHMLMFVVISAVLNPMVTGVFIFIGAPLILTVCVVWFLRTIPGTVAASAGAAIPPEAPLGDGGEELGLVDEIQPGQPVEEYREYDEVEVPPPPQFPANHGQRYFQSGRYTLVPMIRAPPTYAEMVRKLREPILIPKVPPTRRRRR